MFDLLGDLRTRTRWGAEQHVASWSAIRRAACAGTTTGPRWWK